MADALSELFPATETRFFESEAYGALAYKVPRRCQATGQMPRQVLDSLDPSDLDFAPNANDPAAFLASRIDS